MTKLPQYLQSYHYGMTVLKYLLVLSSITFIFFGWFLTGFITDKIDSQRRHGFFHLAGFVALSIEHNKIKALSGTPQDSENTNYLHIKSELAMLRNKFNSNGQTNYCRFIYIWGLRDNKVFFYADSEPENSPDMSPPGQIYTDASPEVFKCFKDGIPFIEGPLKDKWGIWMSSIAPIRDENGKIIALLGMDTDAKEWQKDYSMIRLFVVTIIVMAYLIIICTILMCHISKKASLNHINTTNALEKSEEKYKTLLENLSLGVYSNTPDNSKCFIEANTAMARLFGYDNLEELKKVPISSLYRDISERQKYIEKLQAEGAVRNCELHLIKKDGTPILVSLNAQATFDSKGKISTIFGVMEDITERKKAEEQMNQLNQNLKIANDELRDFAYIASHDLREPLRKITAFGSLLEKSIKKSLNEDDAENLRFMIEGAKRMNQMIDGLLSYSRITTKTHEFENIDLNKTIEDLQKFELSVMIEETKAVINIPQPLPFIKADPVQIRQLMQNLLSNAITYQNKDSIPQITITSKPAANGMIRIEITDNGIGISPEYHASIFNMFKRLHSLRDFQGTGIGLSICKKIVTRHKGEIGLESQLGKGSTFWFTVPVATVESHVLVS